jgi:6-phosphofructokinase 1
MSKRLLIINSGGDCPGMNAVIRAIVKRASQESNWNVIGSINGFDGLLSEPYRIEMLDRKRVKGIHVKGGTILQTNNKRNPFFYPVKQKDGTVVNEDLSDKLVLNLKILRVDAVIHIGGNESHKISEKLYEKGVSIIGIPKTINNDLSVTDYAFGFQTAAEIATDAVDKLVTTANSHNRVLILEVMGRNAGWIALHAAIAGGADVCLIPEIPFSIDKVIEKLKTRYVNGKGFANIVVAEGACPGGENCQLHSGFIARKISYELKKHDFLADIRETILAHLQRGGTPNAFDRILATELGVQAVENVKKEEFGVMVAHREQKIVSVPFNQVIDKYNQVDLNGNLIKTARSIGISFGD